MFEHYIWDFDGTLFDTYPVILEGMVNALVHFGKTPDREEVFRTLKQESSSAVARDNHLDFQMFRKVFQSFEQKDPRTPISYPGTRKNLEQVVKAGHHNYILTHRDFSSTQQLLQKEQLTEFITTIVGSDKEFPRKPDPASINYLMQTYQMDPKKTVMIGDRSLDVMAGKNAGIQTIFFDPEHILADIPEADHIVRSTEALLAFI
ncbi:MAG TPA: HAD-IA family hydrolase [Candidatus Tetragenococcus pullicola]|nr:HAD-IA family hydrolase [Candidatus Tetragenococcus pullicola]